MSGLTISLVAYNINPSSVFVKVPTERGRWLITDRCVVEVGCPLCGAITGEPCRRGSFYRGMRPLPPGMTTAAFSHGVGVHVCRKNAAREKRGGNVRAYPPYKLRARAEDFAAALVTPEAAELGMIADRIDAEVLQIAARSGEATVQQRDRLREIAANLRALAGLDLEPDDIDVPVTPKG